MSEVESINPNTPVTSNLNADGAVEVDATSGPLSFDELDELTKSPKKAKTEEKKETKQEKSKDLTSDTDKGKKSPQPKETKESAGKAEAKSEEKAEGSEDVEKPPRKTVKAKWQDSELDLDEEAVVPVKINGKEELVPIRDLLNNFSGKVAWDKKFSELDQNRKTIQAQETKIKEMANLIKQVYSEQDPNVKMYKMAQFAGMDPMEFREKYFAENISLLEKYYSMTEDERKADALAYEANVHKLRADTLEKGIKEEQAYKELQTKVNQLRERHQISESDFVSKYDQLANQVQSGQLDPKYVTPEYIVDAIKVDRLWSAAADRIEGLNVDWDQQTAINNLHKLVSNAHQLGLEPSDMADIVDELWGSKKTQKKIEDKRKQAQEFLTGKKEVAQAKSPNGEVWSFEQI